MSKSRIFFYFCLSFISGIFISSIIKVSQLFVLGSEPIIIYGLDRAQIFVLWFLILGIILISVLWRYKKIVLIGFCLIFLVLGIWRHQIAELRIINNELRKFNDKEKTVTLIGIIDAEPDIREKIQKLTIKTENLNNKEVEGKVLVTTNRYPEYKYGDGLKISGNLKNPSEDINGFNYRNYLAKDGIYSVMEWPKIELIEGNQGNILYKYLFSQKNKLKESLNKFLSPPQSGFLEALFFGDEENISKGWKDKFNLTGTRHITAVSGMNITIISSLLLNFLLFLGFWRNQAFYFSIILIFLYILMIGAPASAVRAGVMGGLFLVAQHFGRLSAASRAIVFASTFMIFMNPLLLGLDVGFQLSFLAMIGLIYLQPVFLNVFKKIPNIFQLRYTLSATLSAQIFTLPILIYNFGRFSITSPFCNILIVPVLPLITVLGFIFAFFGIIFQSLGLILSLPAWLFLTYIIKVIDFFSQFPFTSIIFKNVHWIWLVISYLILGFLTWRLNKRQKLKFLNY